MRKSILAISATLLVAFGAMPAANAFTLSVVPASTNVTLGELFAVDVIASGLTDGTAPSIGAFDIDLNFDSAVLSPSSVVFGSNLDILGNGSLSGSATGSGAVNAFEVSFDSPSDLNSNQQDTFLLFRVGFQAVSVGTSAFSLFVNSIASGDGPALVPSALHGSSVSVAAAAPVPLPGAVWLLLSALASTGVFARFRRNGA